MGASEDCDEVIGSGSLRRHLAVQLCTCISTSEESTCEKFEN